MVILQECFVNRSLNRSSTKSIINDQYYLVRFYSNGLLIDQAKFELDEVETAEDRALSWCLQNTH